MELCMYQIEKAANYEERKIVLDETFSFYPRNAFTPVYMWQNELQPKCIRRQGKKKV